MAERADYFYRVSTTKQVDHDAQNQADIPVQRKACREFTGKMGWLIFDRLGRKSNDTPFVVEWFVKHGSGSGELTREGAAV